MLPTPTSPALCPSSPGLEAAIAARVDRRPPRDGRVPYLKLHGLVFAVVGLALALPLAAVSLPAALAAGLVLAIGAALALELGDGPAAPLLYAVPGFVVPTAFLAGPSSVALGYAWLPGLVGAIAAAALVSGVRGALHELWAPVSLDWRGRLAAGLSRGCLALGVLFLPLRDLSSDALVAELTLPLAAAPFALALGLALMGLSGDRRRLRFLRLVAAGRHPSKRLASLSEVPVALREELAGLTARSARGPHVLVHAEARGAGAYRFGEASLPLAFTAPERDAQVLGERIATLAFVAVAASFALAALLVQA